MERRKAQAQDQLLTLNQECDITTELLNKLKQMCSNRVNHIVNLDNKNLQLNTKKLIALLKFQSESIQKILEWNIDLEEFLSENGPVDLAQSILINHTNKSLVSECESISTDDCASSVLDVTEPETVIDLNNTNVEIEINQKQNDESTINSENSTDVPYISKTESKLALNKTDLTIKTDVDESKTVEEEPIDREIKNDLEQTIESLDTSLSNDETVVQNYCDNYYSQNESMSSSDNFYSASSFNGDTNSVKTYSEFYSGLEENRNASEMVVQEVPTGNVINNDKYSKDFEINLNLEENKTSKKNEIVLQEVPLNDLIKNDKIENGEDLLSYDRLLNEKEKPNQTVSEKLKSLPIISLQDRYLQSLPKTEMPDLTLRPASESRASLNSNNSNNDLQVPGKLTLENINKVYGSSNGKVTKKVNRKPLQKFQNSIDLEGIPERNSPKVGDVCMIGFVQSPTEIYIQVADATSNILDILSMQLFEHYRNSPPLHCTKSAAMRKLGNFWIFYLNNMFYRVEIIDWLLDQDSEEVLIQMVDYGWKHWVNFNDLRPLNMNLKTLPRIAQLCHLGYLYPPGSTIEKRKHTWPEEVNNGLYEILGNLDEACFRIAHVYYSKHRKSYEIDLIKTEEENEENTIGQLLIDYGLAVEIIDGKMEVMNHEIKNQIRKAQGLNNIAPDTPINDILEKYFQENENEEPETLDEGVTHYTAKDEAETCRNFLRKGYCYKGTSCKFRHIPLTSGFTNDKEPVYDRAFNVDPLPSTNDEVTVIISHVNNIQCFYAQIRRGRNLNNLIKTMNSSSVIKTYKKLKLPPTCSQIVIAKHWNNYWYRARVMNVHIPEDSSHVLVEVFIVDFGDVLEVPMSDLRVITPDLLEISFQAVECRLYNVKHKPGLDPADGKKHFEKLYLGQTFTAKIMAVPGHLEVILRNSDGDNIGLKLIEDGFADLNIDHLFPADNERVLVD